MRKRNVLIQFWLNRKEVQQLDKRSKKAGLTRSTYLRHLIDGVVPKEAPPPDYFSMMRELHQIGNNLNQIALKAHNLHVIDQPKYDEAVRVFQTAMETITSAVISPQKQ